MNGKKLKIFIKIFKIYIYIYIYMDIKKYK